MIHAPGSLLLERDETALASRVLEVLGAAWHFDCFFFFLRQICMCDCLGEKNPHTTEPNIASGDRLPLTISQIRCNVNRVKPFAPFLGSIMYMCLFNQN